MNIYNSHIKSYFGRYFKNLKQLLLVFIVFLSFTSITSAQQASATIDTTQVKIGEEIQYRIQVQADTTAQVVFSDQRGIFAPLEIIESYPIDTIKKDGKFDLIKKYGLTQFDSGHYTIPRQKILINGNPFYTDSLKVAIADVPVDTLKQKMFDIRTLTNVEKTPSNWWKYVLVGLAILGLFALYFYFFVFKLKTKEKKKEKNKIPPFDKALLKLQQLDNSDLLINSQYKNYYTQLTNIVKLYLEEEVKIDALESTTSQLILKLEALKSGGNLDLKEETITNLKNVLQAADLVKFAKSKPDDSLVKADRHLVEHIVVETKEAIPEITLEELRKNEEYQRRLAEEQRKKRVQRNAIIGIVAFLLVLGGSIGYYTTRYLKANHFGYSIDELAEGEWITSEYGPRQLIIETPQVLKRDDKPTENDTIKNPLEQNSFSYKSSIAPFVMRLNIIPFEEKVELDLRQGMELFLKQLEAQGNRNIFVQDANYSFPGGIEGFRTYGDGDFYNEKAMFIKYSPRSYDIYMFQQENILYTFQFFYGKDDVDAQKIIRRILDSIQIKEEDTNAQ